MVPLYKAIPGWLELSNHNIVAVFTMDGVISETNSLFQKFFFAPRRTENNFFDCFPGDEKSTVKKLLRSLSSGLQRTVTYTSVHDIATFFEWEFAVLEDRKEELLFIGLTQPNKNISSKHHQELFDTFINNSPAIAWIADEDGRLIMINDLFKEITGLTDDDENKTIWELFPEELALLYHRNNMQVLTTNEILKTEEISIDRFGNNRNFIVYKFPLKTSGNKKLVGGWSIDITEKKAAESKILEHVERLKEIAFLQSHQVRKPLANILSIVEILELDEGLKNDPETIELLKLLDESAKELDDIIKKISHKTIH